jgi:putative oxidoreductase
MKWLFRTDNDLATLIMRVMLGVVIFPHGAQKLLGWYGGNGFSQTMAFFTEQQGLPWIVAFLVIIAEFFGALGLIVGFLTRLSALGIGAVMLGAISLVHWSQGFFMNWQGNKEGEGYEYHLLALALAVALLLRGGGVLSIDGLLAQRSPRRR